MWKLELKYGRSQRKRSIAFIAYQLVSPSLCNIFLFCESIAGAAHPDVEANDCGGH